ncbi:glycyl-radical enzyme activating protein [Paenibacillus sp.]|uniref:glycyl-radical enzyme activating protein n=1 Tax=Paenibacillus sp. TaxID=58172 RepID=UPI0028A77233|nr:glycyl-radical enzyme activating protein [Paenibacillus sp.]
MLTGIVFDIQRFALHDGPGIRTTVFLKGCPLHCTWCHNPESKAFESQLSFNYEQCVSCLETGHQCPFGVHKDSESDEGNDPFNATLKKLYGLRHHRSHTAQSTAVCECPNGAVKVIGTAVDPDDVIETVLKDRSYYEHSDGGLTISGGEPMAQFAFTLSLARKAKENGLHVCLDTTGHASADKYLEILPYVDVFLYDYKTTDPTTHRRLTGVRNEIIKNNLDLLYQHGASIILRCPIIAGVNDDASHLQGIADLSAKHPKLSGIEVMAYHDLGNHKALRVGSVPQLLDCKTTDPELSNSWIRRLHDMGCLSAKLG